MPVWTVAGTGGRKRRLAFQKYLQNPKERLKPQGKPLTLQPQGDDETSSLQPPQQGLGDLPQQSKRAAARASGLSGLVLL